jgi:hypothetical protein
MSLDQSSGRARAPGWPRARRRVRLLDPAVRCALHCGLRVVERAPVQVLTETQKSAVYRVVLEGTPRSAVVKRSSASLGNAERVLYESVLPELSVRTPRFFGSWEDGGATWLVLEDVGDELPRADAATGAAVSIWAASLHLEGLDFGTGVTLPGRGAAHFAERLSNARWSLQDRLERSDLDAEARSVIELAVARCDVLAGRWPEIERLTAQFPETIVRGDLAEENVRIVRTGGTSVLVPFDWEKAGWGCPALDLALADDDVYYAATRERFGASAEEFATLAVVGAILRVLVHAWATKPVHKVARYERRLTRLMEEAGWSSRV